MECVCRVIGGYGSLVLFGFHTQFQCAETGFPYHHHHHQEILRAPARCPIIQLNSDTFYPEIASDAVAKDSVPQDCPPLQMPVTSPGYYLCFWSTGHKWEVPMILSLGSMNFLERLTELRQPICSLGYLFIVKDFKGYESAAHRVRSWTKEFCPHGVWGPWHVEMFSFPHLKALRTLSFLVFCGGLAI